jgi:HlyD family secretion protein
MVAASGTVRSNQSAWLSWSTSGTVDAVQAGIGEQVSAGQELAALDPSSLPPNIILAQANLIEAQLALDQLLDSRLQQAVALQAVEAAQKALDDLLSPEMAQAQALEAVVNAQETVDDAALQVYLIAEPPSQLAIDQAQANLLLKAKTLEDTGQLLERLQRQIKKTPPAFRGRLKRALQNLEFRLIQDRIAYEAALEKYEDLLEPPDPVNLAAAQAALEAAGAQLEVARREYDREKDGPSPAEIALAEAELADAQREWERLKDGPDPDDIAAADSRVAAAEAALEQARLTAPFAGAITQAEISPGDQVRAGSRAFRLDDLSRLLVDVDLSEVDVNRVQAGQEALLTFEAIPLAEYHGRVIEVAPVGTESDGGFTFLVRIEILDADRAVRPGMTAAAEILIDPVE